MQILFFINGNDENRVIRIQNPLCNLQPFLHHGEPLAVTIAVGGINIVVVVLPVAGTCVVWGIDIYAFDLPCEFLLERFEPEQVVTKDEPIVE